MNSPGVQPVQLFAVSSSGAGLVPAQVLQPAAGPAGIQFTWVGQPFNVGTINPVSLLQLDTTAGLTPDAVTAAAMASIAYGFNQAGAFVPVNVRTPTDDAIDLTAENGPLALSMGYGFNGTNATGLDRLRTASAVTLNPALTKVGVQQVENAGRWSQAVEAAVTVQATTTKALVAGARHVCTSIGGSLVAVGAIAAPLYLRLRDGASGAGTILWSQAFTVPAAGVANFAISGLSIAGSVGTAMTLEWSAAPGATNFQTVSLSGFTA